jgi:transposase
MAIKRRKFSEEFKAEAVRIWREGGRPQSQMARELGVVPSVLDRWDKKQRKVEQRGSTRSGAKAEREELQRLRRENEVLREERDFLRSAAAFFAKESK